MLSIVIDGGSDNAVLGPITAALTKLDVQFDVWEEPDPIPICTDALVTHVDRLSDVQDCIAQSDQQPRVVVLAPDLSGAESRRLLSNGVVACIPSTGSAPDAQAFAIVATATGIVATIPQDHGHYIASRLEEPPRPLTRDEAYFLGLAATRTIEATGTSIGLSRRQAQRRFKRVCDDLGLANHKVASVKAARWGLVDTNGEPTTAPAPG